MKHDKRFRIERVAEMRRWSHWCPRVAQMTCWGDEVEATGCSTLVLLQLHYSSSWQCTMMHSTICICPVLFFLYGNLHCAQCTRNLCGITQHSALSSVHPNAWFCSALSLRARHCWSRRSVCLRRWYLNRHRFTNSEPHTSLCSNQKEGSQFKSTDCVHKTWWSISNLWIVMINLFEHLSLGGICVLARRPIYCFA